MLKVKCLFLERFLCVQYSMEECISLHDICVACLTIHVLHSFGVSSRVPSILKCQASSEDGSCGCPGEGSATFHVPGRGREDAARRQSGNRSSGHEGLLCSHGPGRGKSL